jgi:hypothetical protein
MSNAEKKIKFILLWYNSQSRTFNLVQRLELLRQWINTCVKYEEYEMAATLRKERGNIMRKYRKKSGGLKMVFKRIVIRLRYSLRKVKNYL